MIDWWMITALFLWVMGMVTTRILLDILYSQEGEWKYWKPYERSIARSVLTPFWFVLSLCAIYVIFRQREKNK